MAELSDGKSARELLEAEAAVWAADVRELAMRVERLGEEALAIKDRELELMSRARAAIDAGVDVELPALKAYRQAWLDAVDTIQSARVHLRLRHAEFAAAGGNPSGD